MKNKLKIALLQINPLMSDQKGNLLKGEDYCRKAKEKGADIVLFPEMWNTGYEFFNRSEFDIDFVPEDNPEKIKEKVKILNSKALKPDSKFIIHFRKLARELEIAIAITFLQKGKGKPLNSVALIDRFGNIMLNYSKVHTCDFSIEYYCESGKEFPVCELNTLKGNIIIGAMICFDREFPESARELMLKGAEIILIPNCCDMDKHRTAQLKSRAFENMTGIAMANYPFPKCNGRSQAYSPIAYDKSGKELDNLILMADSDEGIFIAEFDIEEIRNYRKREVWGNNFRKPESYKNLNLSGKNKN